MIKQRKELSQLLFLCPKTICENPFNVLGCPGGDKNRHKTLAFISSLCYNTTVRKPSTVWISERQALYDFRP